MTYQPLSEQWRRFENIWPSHAKMSVCCALTIRYIYHMVGRSTADMSDLGSIFTKARKHISVWCYSMGYYFM